jgi:hypothetical protein
LGESHGGRHNAVRWQQRIHWQKHRFVIDRASESLGEAWDRQTA